MEQPLNSPPVKERAAGAKTLGIVSLAIFCSRILGLVREVCVGALFGGAQRRWLDCFNMAFRTPNMLRDLFAEGALSTAFVTVFSKKLHAEGDEAAWKLAQRMATLTVVAMSVVSIVGILLAPVIVGLLAPGWIKEPDKFWFTVYLARIMYPFIMLVSLGALVMGMLNAKKVFGMPAMSSTFFNLGAILGGGVLGYLMDPHWGQKALVGFSIGTLIGGLCQLVCQFPALHRIGFRWGWDWGWRGDSGVKQILKLMGPAIISGGAVQVNVWLNSVFATMIKQDGPVSWLGFAFRLMQLPLGLFGVAIATITLPSLARQAIQGAQGDFRSTLAQGLRLTLFLTIPCGIGLAILAEPIISLIYEHGRFDSHDTLMTAAALRFYAFGLVFYSGIKILQPSFYAIDKRYYPMVVSLIAIGVSAALNAYLILGLHRGHASLALTTAAVAGLNFLMLYYGMRKHTGHLEDREFGLMLTKLSLACGLLALVCWGGKAFLMADWQDFGFLRRSLSLGLTISLGGLLYMATAHRLHLEECRQFTRLLARKMGRQ